MSNSDDLSPPNFDPLDMKVILGEEEDAGDDTAQQFDIENDCGGLDSSPIDDDGIYAESAPANAGDEVREKAQNKHDIEEFIGQVVL